VLKVWWDHFTAELMLSEPMQEFWKLVSVW